MIFFDKLRLNVISNFIASTTENFLLLLKEYFISNKLKYRWKKSQHTLSTSLSFLVFPFIMNLQSDLQNSVIYMSGLADLY